MQTKPNSISDLISRWPTIAEFSAAIGCGYEAARQMRRRGSIAPEHWGSVVAASAAHGVPGVTNDWLAEQRAPSKHEAA